MQIKKESELKKVMTKQITKAMSVVEKKALADMYEETGGYYDGSEPTMYIRTGALSDTPKTTALSVESDKVSFVAYLDTNYIYKTGKHPTMLDVLNLTNSGIKNSSVGRLRPTIGKKYFWKRAKIKIKNDLQQTLNEFLK